MIAVLLSVVVAFLLTVAVFVLQILGRLIIFYVARGASDLAMTPRERVIGSDLGIFAINITFLVAIYYGASGLPPQIIAPVVDFIEKNTPVSSQAFFVIVLLFQVVLWACALVLTGKMAKDPRWGYKSLVNLTGLLPLAIILLTLLIRI